MNAFIRWWLQSREWILKWEIDTTRELAEDHAARSRNRAHEYALTIARHENELVKVRRTLIRVEDPHRLIKGAMS